MSVQVDFLPEASEDLESAFWWYERQKLRLGHDFLGALDAAFREIAERPRSFPIVARKTRKVVVRRFPYLVFFALEEERILVTGVLHAHRDPDSWEKRIREPTTTYSGRPVAVPAT